MSDHADTLAQVTTLVDPPLSPTPPAAADRVEFLLGQLVSRGRADRVRHVHRSPERPGRREPWPSWGPELLLDRWHAAGICAPWAHQVAAAETLWDRRSVVLATGTASGKSLA